MKTLEYGKKDTILKLLSSMSSEKEIRKYLDRFSSDDYRFAVIKVGGLKNKRATDLFFNTLLNLLILRSFA